MDWDLSGNRSNIVCIPGFPNHFCSLDLDYYYMLDCFWMQRGIGNQDTNYQVIFLYRNKIRLHEVRQEIWSNSLPELRIEGKESRILIVRRSRVDHRKTDTEIEKRNRPARA